MAGYNMALQFPGRAFWERFSRETAAERSAPLFDGAFSTPQTFLLQPDFSRDESRGRLDLRFRGRIRCKNSLRGQKMSRAVGSRKVAVIRLCAVFTAKGDAKNG